MFKKLLFTDKCILNTDTNTVIFDFEEDWKEYTKWSQDNIESEYKIQQDKQAELSWNQGAVHKRVPRRLIAASPSPACPSSGGDHGGPPR